MTGERTTPGLGLTAFWDLGSGFKSGMDTNLQTLSVVTQLRAKSRTTSLPGSPSDGDIYIVPTGDTNAEDIALRDDGTWYYITPTAGFMAYVEDEAIFCDFDGSAWSQSIFRFMDVGSFIAGTPSDAETILRLALARAVTFPSGLTGSQADAGVAATGSVDFSLKKNGTEFATCNFNAGATGTFTAASATSFAAGDILSIVAPATADATLADISLTLKGAL